MEKINFCNEPRLVVCKHVCIHSKEIHLYTEVIRKKNEKKNDSEWSEKDCEWTGVMIPGEIIYHLGGKKWAKGLET